MEMSDTAVKERGKKMKIPWAKPYMDEEEIREINRCLRSGWLAMGPRVEKLEKKAKTLIGARHAIAVNSGTAALDVALKILGVKPGDEIIVPAMTYIATVNAVLYQGARPVFADINDKTYNISPLDVKKKIGKKTKGIIVIDYGGLPADYAALQKIARKNKLFIVEDGAQSFGGKYQGRSLCSFGEIATTSFHMAKIVTAIEGGMVFTNNPDYAEAARIIRSQGEDLTKKYHHPRLGHNYRMSDLHASIGLAQLRRFKKVMAKRLAITNFYFSQLKDISSIQLPKVRKGDKPAWFLFPILVRNRDELKSYLSAKGITTNVSWPMPVYNQPFYQKYKSGTAPIAEKITKSVLCLPLYYEMTKKEQQYVVDAIKDGI